MDISDLKKYLPHGSIKKIAAKCGVTEQYLSMILSGKRDSRPDITREVLRIAKANKQLHDDVAELSGKKVKPIKLAGAINVSKLPKNLEVNGLVYEDWRELYRNIKPRTKTNLFKILREAGYGDN